MGCTIIRKKYRYVLVVSSADVNVEASASAIGNEIMRFMGELSYSKANPRVAAQYDPKTFVIKLNKGFEREVILALSFIKNLNGRRIGFATVKTSGTIRSFSIYR